MSIQRVALLVLALASIAAGCGENAGVKAAKEMADAVCACEDALCAAKAAKEGGLKLQKVRDNVNDAELKLFIEHSKRMMMCLERFK